MMYKLYNSLPEEAKNIRTQVFIEEQGFKEEFDSIDNNAVHIVFFDCEKAVATGRFFTDDGKGYHIGRLAVIKEYRGSGIGKKIMTAIEEEIQKTDAKSISLSAQLQAKGFYEKCGYTAVGGIYFDEHCKHIKMIKKLK